MHFYFLFAFISNAISTLDLVRKRTLALKEGPIKESFQCRFYILTISQVFTKGQLISECLLGAIDFPKHQR